MKAFFARMEESHLDGKPLHIADPESSSFEIISHETFQGMSPSAIQGRLRSKNIVVTGCPHPNIEFNKQGLETLTSLDRQISIQGAKSR